MEPSSTATAFAREEEAKLLRPDPASPLSGEIEEILCEMLLFALDESEVSRFPRRTGSRGEDHRPAF